MPDIFDIARGEIHLSEYMILKRGLQFDSIAKVGFEVEREHSTGTDWNYKSSSGQLMASHNVVLTLGLHAQRLESISLAFMDDSKMSDKELLAVHSAFLRKELGAPARKIPAGVIYDYPWGTISSEYDPRGGSVSISVRWK